MYEKPYHIGVYLIKYEVNGRWELRINGIPSGLQVDCNNNDINLKYVFENGISPKIHVETIVGNDVLDSPKDIEVNILKETVKQISKIANVNGDEFIRQVTRELQQKEKVVNKW